MHFQNLNPKSSRYVAGAPLGKLYNIIMFGIRVAFFLFFRPRSVNDKLQSVESLARATIPARQARKMYAQTMQSSLKFLTVRTIYYYMLTYQHIIRVHVANR